MGLCFWYKICSNKYGKGGVIMGCCGGGHYQHNQSSKKEDVNNQKENTRSISTMHIIGGLFILGLLVVYFLQ